MKEKEFLYVGFYIDTGGQYILKIGTTNDLKRRQMEHNRNYKRAKTHTMPKDGNFTYLWHLELSKYNTLRYEDKNRKAWQDKNLGEFVRNDRFVLSNVPNFVEVKIRKTYQISLKIEGDSLVKITIDFWTLAWYNGPALYMRKGPVFKSISIFNNFSPQFLYILMIDKSPIIRYNRYIS